MLWKRLKGMLAARDQRLAIDELRRESAEAEGPPLPHTGGALFDEPFQPTESVPGDDLPDAPPA